MRSTSAFLSLFLPPTSLRLGEEMHRPRAGYVKIVQECEGPAGSWDPALGFHQSASTAEYSWLQGLSGERAVCFCTFRCIILVFEARPCTCTLDLLLECAQPGGTRNAGRGSPMLGEAGVGTPDSVYLSRGLSPSTLR